MSKKKFTVKRSTIFGWILGASLVEIVLGTFRIWIVAETLMFLISVSYILWSIEKMMKRRARRTR